MHILVNQAREQTDNYIRGGNKDVRRTEVNRINYFLDWCEDTERVRNIHGLGRKHVERFWKAHRDLEETTRKKYWLAICHLWVWYKILGEPPEPLTDEELKSRRERRAAVAQQRREAQGLSPEGAYPDLKAIVHAAMDKNKLSVGKLANITGVTADEQEALLSVADTGDFRKLYALMQACGIRFSIQPLPEAFRLGNSN